jgi:imidazolonepropionase-like amidohydrolase
MEGEDAKSMIAVVGGEVRTITQGVLKPGTVLVESGRIAEVGQAVDVPPEAKVYDASGKVVMPGLIDAHCHVGILADGIGRSADDSNETTDPITPHLRALDAINPDDLIFQDLVEAGVTTVCRRR